MWGLTVLFAILGLLITLAIPVGIVLLIIWAVRQGNKSAQSLPAAPPPPPAVRIDERDWQWRQYIMSFRERITTKTGRQMLDQLLSDPDAPDMHGLTPAYPAYETAQTHPAQAAFQAWDSPTMAAPVPPQPPAVPAPRQELDGTLLLLYFGAFLFVASAGLFVAFAGLSGVVRTFIVLLVMAVLYSGGFWLHRRSKRLQPAGVAFVAIGMAIAPLVGVAAYHFIAGNQHAPVIWLLTSLLCLGMYSYAFTRLRLTFMSYLFIFSFLSLFESAVSMVDASAQYEVWGLIVAGMIVRAAGLKRGDPLVREPAAISAQVLVPLGLVISTFIVPDKGLWQLSVSVLLAAVYYTFEAVEQQAERVALAVASHILYIFGVTLAVYAGFHSLAAVAWALLGGAAAHLLVIVLLPARGQVMRNFATVAYGAAIAGVVLAYPNGTLMALLTGMTLMVGVAGAYFQRRPDMLTGGALALIGLPLIVGQFAVNAHWTAADQTVIAFIPVVLLWRLWAYAFRRKLSTAWRQSAVQVYIAAGVVALLTGLAAGHWWFFGAALGLAATLMMVSRASRDNQWWAAAGVVAALPIVFSGADPRSQLFSASVFVAVLVNIAITLTCRAEVNRWMVAIAGLLVPVAIGAGGLGFRAGTVGFAYLYLLVMFGLLLCRSLARGVYMASSKIPVMSFYRSASVSYVVGYVAAAAIAVCISLASVHSRIHTSVILAVLLVVIPYVARTIEDRLQYVALMPWIAVALIVSLFRPSVGQGAADAVVMVVSVLAIMSYEAVRSGRQRLSGAYREVLNATWLLSFVPLLLCIWYGVSVGIPPLVLAIAGCMTLYHVWERPQGERELSGLILVAALMWGLGVAGVHNIQAYTHILAATFALYAYWRYTRGDRHTSDEYLYAMLATATIPLALQILNGLVGDMYGWWLLLEQVCFMLLGIYIHRKFVTMWGLYVAIGAVLYQLRGLGWAALSVLALFIIGMAIWRLVRSSEHRSGE